MVEQINSKGWWKGLASEIYNADFLSTLLYTFLFRHRVYTDNCSYSIPEIGREQNGNFCMRTHNGTVILSSPLSCFLSFFLSFFLFRETLEAVTAHWLLNSLNDDIQQNLIICIHIYSSSIFLKISSLTLGFLMSPHRISSWLRRETGLTVEHLGNKTSPGLSQ